MRQRERRNELQTDDGDTTGKAARGEVEVLTIRPALGAAVAGVGRLDSGEATDERGRREEQRTSGMQKRTSAERPECGRR